MLRGDVDSRDVILLSWFLAHVEDDEWAERTPRLLDRDARRPDGSR